MPKAPSPITWDMLYFEFINVLVWGEAPDELHEKQMRKLRKACGNVAMPKKVGRRSKK